MVRALGALLFGLCWFAMPAAASPRRPSLHWTRGRNAESCIDPLTLSERVEALTGPVFAPPAEYAIEGHIEARSRGFTLRISVTDAERVPKGERVVVHHGADCRTFDDAIVFLIALMIDPDLDLERLTRVPELAGHAPGEALLRELDEHPPAPATVEATVVQREVLIAPTQEPYRWDASASLTTSWSELPELALGPTVAVAFPLAAWFELGAQVRSIVAREHHLDAGQSIRTQSFSLAALSCTRTATQRIGVRACLAPEQSLMRARGLGFDRSERAFLSVWGALGKLELWLQLSDRWALSLHAFARRAVDHKRFVYTSPLLGTIEIAQVARWSGGVGIGFVHRFRSGKGASSTTDLRNVEDER